MKRQIVNGIALKAYNSAGGHYFMSLYMGKNLHSYIWKELPIDQDVIDRVHHLAKEEKQLLLLDDHPIF